jgi:hypothetical protein
MSDTPPTPGYAISLSDDGSYVVVKITGDITTARADEFGAAAARVGAELGIDRLLVDATKSRNVDSILGNYQFAYDAARTFHHDRRVRIAALVSPGDHSHDFVETVTRNAGVDFTLFTDRDAALRHLRGEVSSGR